MKLNLYNNKNWYLIIVMFLFVACASTSIPTTTTLDDASVAISRQLIPVLQELSKNKNITIAIIPPGGPKGRPAKFGRKMASLLQLQLLSRSWKLVEREQIDKVIGEQELAASGIVEESDYIHTGTVLGADYIVTGTAFPGKNKKALLSVKIINVKTSAVEGIAQVYIAFKE
jgi:curli biogenesis system outer membrane secretion channel CsgG